MNIYLVYYRINSEATSAPERELDIEHELSHFVRHQVGPGKSRVASDKSMDEIFRNLCGKIQDAGCLFILSRDGMQHCIYPSAIGGVLSTQTLTEAEYLIRAKELFDTYLNDINMSQPRPPHPQGLSRHIVDAAAA